MKTIPFLRPPALVIERRKITETVEYRFCPMCNRPAVGWAQNLNEEPARRVYSPCKCEWLEGRDV